MTNMIETLTATAREAAVIGVPLYVTNPYQTEPHIITVAPSPFAYDIQIKVYPDGTAAFCCNDHGEGLREMPRFRLVPPPRAEEEATEGAFESCETDGRD
jgi:hypothetical protein